ncbi:MAG TPA: M20 family metallopeptidase [Pyrinomonadaceae bacterium]|jgi:glutamate carboxypeptidase
MSKEINAALANSLREYMEKRQGEIRSLMRALAEEESPSGDVKGSRAVVELLLKAVDESGVAASVERLPARGNYGEHLRVHAFGRAAQGERTTLLLGHTDTVHPRGTLRERPWREEAGRIYAPGIFDMKANCVLALEALRACAELSLAPTHPVVLLLTCDEETGSAHGGRELVEDESRRADAVLVLEPPAPGRRVKTARKGTGMYALVARGRAAHAGLDPEKGASAILEIARQIARLDALNDAAQGTTLNVGVVCGGTRSNVVAAEARAEIDVRFSTAVEAKRLEEAMHGLQPFDARVQLEIEGGINRPPMERTEAVVRLYEHARRIAALLDFELGEASVGGASDGNFAAANCAAVLDGLGVEGDGAHAEHEHIIAADIALRGALLAGLITSL